ncbi:acyl-CoA thioesterase/BAAT N-terminal domain-containing protein [Oerskovia jenensis]|uniref:Dienelactone hydrolase n=1 Tax=Oerskovia jenensis TaxID=162169 RepID=A0ABS2LK34_9CELL|nr:acyl-CoA thioesterase/BAAT N-terminal domain-containing protein [Oerskovia jenensis]MBM7480793.1 dienelactone hydrolase [Oerskovia jenensis]
MASRRRDPVPAVALLLTAPLLVIAACSAPPVQEPAIEVVAQEGAFDPLAITLTGLGAGQEVRLEATAGIGGSAYSSHATFIADDEGRVDLADVAPTDGSWTTPDAMGPFWSMVGPPSAVFERRADHQVRLTVSAGDEELTHVVVERRGALTDARFREVGDDGLIAYYAAPSDLSTDEPLPAVLVFGGSEGGLDAARASADSIAALGYPALAVSYFKSPGQPSTLTEVPVETFLTGLEWLRAQPGVDTERVFAFGTSRGGEMALWLAANRPEQVYGAFAPVGAGYLVCGIPDARKSAWTFEGSPMPCLPMNEPMGSNTAVQVPVEEVSGPVVLACGSADAVWRSCDLLDEMASRFDDPERVHAIVQRGAGHLVTAPPYVPWGLDEPGATPAATHQARVDFWDAVDAVLAQARQE